VGDAEPKARRSVLRLASVFEVSPEDLHPGAARFDPVGGMQTHTAALTRALDRLGLGQTVVTSRLSGRPVRRLLEEHSLLVRVGLPVSHWRQLWALSALPHLLCPGQRLQVVHAHQGEDVAVLGLGFLASKLNRCPLVVTVHCSVAHTMTGSSLRSRVVRGLGAMVERRVLPRADAVIVLADRTRRLLSEGGVPVERIQVLPSGFDPELFAGAGEDRFPELPRPRVAYVGRLAEQKRPDLVLRAFEQMRSNAHLVVVGDGPQRLVLERQAKAGPRGDRITFTGFVAHGDIPDVLRSVDVLVMPSGYEELGSVLVEAMAVGLPVVASRVGGIPEVVSDGETGLLVEPGDAASLGRAIDRLVADPALRRSMGQRALERSNRYAWPVLALEVHDLYRHLLTEVRPRP
jgi:glycogen(starch) synthase